MRSTSPTRLALLPLVAAALLAASCGTADNAAVPAGSAAATGSSAAPSAGSSASSAAGTSSGAAPSSSVAAGGATTVKVEITDAAGCAITPDSVAAGPVTFAITNVDATAVTEVHLMQGDRIRGERENVAPGFENTFSMTLDGGSYEVYCPGTPAEHQPFTVTGKAAEVGGDVGDLLRTATVDYSEYVSAQAGFLVEGTDALAAAIKSGDLAKSQQAYAKVRPFFERIEPVAESFGDLDPDIDAREGDVPAKDWKGFHQIEQALFTQKSVARAQPYVADLVANVAKLQQLTADLETGTKAGKGNGYQPDEVANGAASLLEEVQKTKITGEEERYSHIDLVDFAANVEGSQQAFAALQPALDEIDPSIADPIAAKFTALITLLDTHQDAAALGGYTLYGDLTKDEIKKLAAALLAVQEPLSQISAKVAAAG
ncbi:MAG: iron uptake system protein EfeO [Nakamurella sp.]